MYAVVEDIVLGKVAVIEAVVLFLYRFEVYQYS